jgi:hypothetical protein
MYSHSRNTRIRLRSLALSLALVLTAVAPAFAQQSSQMLGTVNASVVIATGNTFQQVLAAATKATKRNSLTIQNNNATDACWVYVGPTASATKGTALQLAAGQSYTRYYPYVPSDVIAATCATTSDTLYVDTQ